MTETPDLDPQGARFARREPLLHLLGRMQRGVLLDTERGLLRAAVETELADGDAVHAAYGTDLASVEAERADARAAYEGLREALRSAFGAGPSVSDDDLFEHIREAVIYRDRADKECTRLAAELAEARPGGGQRITASDVLVQHDVTRKALALALGEGLHLNWDQLIAAAKVAVRVAEQETQESRDARQGEAEAVRARKAAEANTREAKAVLRTTEQQLGDARRRIERMQRTNRMVNAGAREERERAEQAEAALAAVRKAAQLHRQGLVNYTELYAVIEGPLGDPQQAEAEPDLGPCWVCDGRPVVYRNLNGSLICPDCVRCNCGETPCVRTGTNDPAVSSDAAEAEHTCPDSEPCPILGHDQPAEPLLRGEPEVHVQVHVPAIDLAAREIVNTARRIIFGRS